MVNSRATRAPERLPASDCKAFACPPMDAVLAADHCHTQPSLLIIDQTDDLHLGETALLQGSASSRLGRQYINVRTFPRKQVNAVQCMPFRTAQTEQIVDFRVLLSQLGMKQMQKEPENGDKVSWNSHAGQAHGKVVKKIVKPMTIKGHHVAAPKDNPEFLVETPAGKRAAHKAKALKQE